MRSKKAAIVQLEKQARQLARQQQRLAETNTALQAQATALEELIKQRNVLMCMLERVASHCAQRPAGISHGRADAATHPEDWLPEGERLLLHELPPLEQPLVAVTASIDDALYRSISAITPAAAADYWLERVKEVALAVRLHRRDPEGMQQLLQDAVTRAMCWVRALHIFNPRIVYALHDYNLLTCRYDPPPPSHWTAALRASAPTPEQVRATRAMLSVVRPRLERLEARKQQLLAELHSLEQPGDIDALPTQQAAVDGRTGVPAESMASANADGAAASSGAAGDAHAASQPSACSRDASSSSSMQQYSDLETAAARLQRRQELVQQLAQHHAAWRTTSQMRAHWLTATFTYEQLGAAILAAFPYVPHGAPVFDGAAAQAAGPSP